MQPKILFINGSFKNDSGCAVIAQNTYKMFKNRGFDVEYYTTQGFTNDKTYKFSKYFPEHFNTISKYILNQWRYYYNWTSRKNIEKVLKEFKPNIVHVHSLRISSMTYSVLQPIIKNNIPIIMTLHDCFLICPTMRLIKGNGEFCDAKCKGINKLHCILNNCDNTIELNFRWAMMSFVNKLTNYDKYINKFIAPSNALKNLMIKYNNDINENNIVTINNFLLTDELKTKPNYANKGYFLYIGRLSKEKSVITLLQAMSGLPRDIKLHIVGTGPEEENLKKYAEENELHNIEFLGFKTGADIQDEYQNCIATILPCNWFEIFGMTNIESFANGKPVIASNIGGIPEIVEHNVNGLLFEPGNVEQLKECILKYWNNPELVVEHGKNGYKKVLTNYTEGIYYEKLIKLYEEILNDSKKHNN